MYRLSCQIHFELTLCKRVIAMANSILLVTLTVYRKYTTQYEIVSHLLEILKQICYEFNYLFDHNAMCLLPNCFNGVREKINE